MQRHSILRAIAPIAVAVLLISGAAHADHADPVPYALTDGSTFEFGCYAPCLCPIFVTDGLRGTFVLAHAGSDPLFETYRVLDVDWTVQHGGEAVRVTGSGEYRIGGEFALQHRLILDLEVDGNGPQRFDSGLTVGGYEFPHIRIATAVHGFFCFDSAFVVSAAPQPLDVGPPAAGRFGITRIAPNPFGDATVIEYALPRPARVSASVFDASGRRVRALSTAAWRASGIHRVEWHGRDDDGAAVRAGLYFVRISDGAAHDVRRVVRF